MKNFTELAPARPDQLVPLTDQLRLAVAAYLARFKGSSREHTESDLRCYLTWCAEDGLDPLAAQRPHLELYIRFPTNHVRTQSAGPADPSSRTVQITPHRIHAAPWPGSPGQGSATHSCAAVRGVGRAGDRMCAAAGINLRTIRAQRSPSGHRGARRGQLARESVRCECCDCADLEECSGHRKAGNTC